jgi:phosphate transport system permease protein
MTTLTQSPAAGAPLPDPSSPPPDEPERAQPDGFDAPRRLRARTTDDVLALAGSGMAALAVVWLVFEQLLALSGTLGFLVCWYLAFLALYAAVTATSNPRTVVLDRVAATWIHAGALVVALGLATATVYTFVQGAPALAHASFFTQDMAGVGPTAPLSRGGVLHALVGSAIEIAIAGAVSVPLGVATAVYMTEVGGRFSRAVRTIVEAMTALPSIVAGLFVYTALIVGLHLPRTGFTAAMAISVMMLPIIARASDVALRVVPGGLREAGLALGASHWETVRRVVLPTARPGLATAVILGVARSVGETSPVLLTSGASTYFNANPLQDPMNSLPLFVFSSVRSGESLYISRGFGAAAVLLAGVLVLFVLTRFVARQRVASR